MLIGTAPGYDSISNEHLNYSKEKLHVLMSLLYSQFCLNHLSDGVGASLMFYCFKQC